MKNIAAYYLLLLYTLVLCKPILPLIHDELAHIFWKAKHLATVHHHHGDHHAQHEVAEAEHPENTNQQPAATKTFEPVSIHIVVEILCDNLHPTINKQLFAVNIYNVSTVSLDKHYPPPKHC